MSTRASGAASPPSVATRMVATAFFIIAYFAYAIDLWSVLRQILVVMLAGSLLVIGLRWPLPRWAARLGIATGVVAPLVYVAVKTTIDLDPGGTKTLTYLVALVPTAILGALVHTASGTRPFARIYVAVSVGVAALGIAESIRYVPLLARPDLGDFLYRGGQLRAVVGAEHPVVLGAFFAVAAVVAVLALPGLWAVPTCLILMVGIYCTVSRGALVVVLAGLVLAAVATWRRRPMTPWLARGLAVASLPLLVLAFVAQTSLSGSVDSYDAVEASAQYRSAILYAIPTQLEQAPFGHGPAGLPRGEVFIQTQFGPLDLSDSVDSEIGLLAFQFGIPGLLAFAALWVLCLSQVLQRNRWAVPAMVVLGAGFSVGVHAWLGLGTLGMFTFGVAVASAFSAPPPEDDRSAERVPDPGAPADADEAAPDEGVVERPARQRSAADEPA